MEQKIDINPIPYLTWNWLKINKDSTVYDFTFEENYGSEIQIPHNVEISNGKAIKTLLPEPEYAIGKAAADFIQNGATTGRIYTFKKSNDNNEIKPLIIRITPENNSSAVQIIHAIQGAEAKIIIVYSPSITAGNKAGTSVSNLSGILTKIYAEENATVHITKVNLLGQNQNQIDETSVVCGDNAKVTLTQIELGGSHVDAGFHATLQGYKSSFYSDTAYITQNNQYIDMNQVVVHKGKKTDCNMKTDGTLKDNGTKTYRGTIDLRKECAGSKGNEMETTLLLSPTAIEKSAPIILCGEEDIAAEHGSTVGKLSKEMLFYMNSRGIDQATAEALLTRAKITACAANIPDEKIQEEINEWLNNELSEE